jgi:hypothetical protein
MMSAIILSRFLQKPSFFLYALGREKKNVWKYTPVISYSGLFVRFGLPGSREEVKCSSNAAPIGGCWLAKLGLVVLSG